MKQRLHWTVSSLKDYETCPARYRWTYLFEASDWRALGYKLVPSTESPAMLRGTAIHKTCEDYLLGTVGIEGLHRDIGLAWRSMIHGLKGIGARPEEQWEFEEGWHPREGGQVWLRMKIDAHYLPSAKVLHVIDYKTGKPYVANMEQVEVYAIGGFAKFDDVDTIIGELWYLDHEEPHEKTFHRSQVSKLARKWEQRADRLLSAQSYPERQNQFCSWCPYNGSKGGPCQSTKKPA